MVMADEQHNEALANDTGTSRLANGNILAWSAVLGWGPVGL